LATNCRTPRSKYIKRRKKTAERKNGHPENMDEITQYIKNDWLVGSLKKAASLKILARYNIDA
jgi:hypothetical protein